MLSGRRRLYLIDGNAQIFRAYFAPFRPLTSPSGEPTRATHVFCQFLLNLLETHRPEYILMAMDVGDRETFRSAIYADYKATREAPPEDLAPQKKRILQIVEAMGIPIVRVDGFEADDVIATLADRHGRPDPDGLDVVIVSRDKDLRQLLNDHVSMYDPQNDAWVTPASMQRDLGYGPAQAVEVQCLCGDNVDNIPGARGVGDKTAAKLIQRYGTAKAVLAAAAEQTPALARNLQAFAPLLEQTRALVTLRRDVPVETPLEAMRWDGLRLGNAEPLFVECGFGRLTENLRRLAGAASGADAATPAPAGPGLSTAAGAAADAGGTAATPTTAADATYRLVDSAEALAEFVEELRSASLVAFDCETTGFSVHDSQLAGIALSIAPGTGVYIPVATSGIGQAAEGDPGDLFSASPPPDGGADEPVGRGTRLAIETVRACLGPMFADASVAKVAHNAKFDILALRNAGIAVAGLSFDTMVASYLLNPAGRHGLKELGLERLNHASIRYEDVAGSGRGQLRFDQIDTAQAVTYAAEDADVTLRLYAVLSAELDAQPRVRELFDRLEMPLLRVLADMEWAGVAIDTALLDRLNRQFEGELERLGGRIHAAAGAPFLINSPKQLAEVLFDRFKLPVVKRTKAGRSTDADVLEELAGRLGSGELSIPAELVPGASEPESLVRLVLDYRELHKLRSTYVEPLGGMRSVKTGRLHARFNQTVAETGRLSSSHPNLQNIPIRTEQGRQLRAAFVAAEPGQVLISADYSQIELRLLAHLSKDPALREAFAQDQDIHTSVAAQVFGTPMDEVTREQRGRAKAVNFGIVYGQTGFGLARTLGIGRAEAETFIQRYRQKYSGITSFLEQCVEQARSQGFVETILGRRRYIDGIGDRSALRRNQAERLAINTVVQGSAADLIKQAMVNLWQRIGEGGLGLRMLIQVHDELVFECAESEAAGYSELIRTEMSGALALEVPIRVDIGWGRNWLEVK